MKRLAAMLLCICILFGLCLPTDAQAVQYQYSTSKNSGSRHEVCTTLEGTRVDSYYTGSYTYGKLSAMQGDALLDSLRALLTSTHTKKSKYDDAHYKADKTDCENGNGKITLIYTGYDASMSDWCNDRSSGWNREHVWPKSLGDFSNNDTPGCDLHHVRPSDQPINSTRGNKKYGYVNGGKAVYGADYTGKALGGHFTSSYFEPLDNVKGDVARICLYVYVRYGGDAQYTCDKITNVFQSVDVLLEWCALDPVDTWEMGRNEVVAAIQGNRNVFIDYPELAWLLFSKEVPANMTTPSNGNVSGGNTSNPTQPTEKPTQPETQPTETVPSQNPCRHSNSETHHVKKATCTEDGYSGDTYCLDCGATVSEGKVIPAEGHSFGRWVVVQEATTQAPGREERACGLCGHREAQEIPQLEDPNPTQPTEKPTQPETQPTEPVTQPTESVTRPTAPSTQPSRPADPAEPKEDYRWLVFVVLGIGAVGCIAVVMFQTRRKNDGNP